MYFGNNIHTPKGGTLHLEVRGQDAPRSYEICANFPVRALKHPVTLAQIKADTAFTSFPLVRMARLSVMPVNDDEWARIEDISKA